MRWLIGEAEIETKKVYIKKATYATVVVVIVGFIAIAYGYFTEVQFVKEFLSNAYALVAIVLSGILLFPLWKSVRGGRRVLSRTYAGLQVLLILFAALFHQFPYLLFTTNSTISIMDNVAPDSVVNVLGITLLIGGFVILPGLFHLLKSFKMIKILEK